MWKCGDAVMKVMRKMHELSAGGRWGAARDKRDDKKQRSGHDDDPVAEIVAHLNKWPDGMPEKFKTYPQNNKNSRSFLFAVDDSTVQMEDTVALVADKLLHVDTRTAIAYNKKGEGQTRVSAAKMRAAMFYLLRLPIVVAPVKRGVDEWTAVEERLLIATMTERRIAEGPDAKHSLNNFQEFAKRIEQIFYLAKDSYSAQPTRTDAFAQQIAHLFEEHHPFESGSIQRKVRELLSEGNKIYMASITSGRFSLEYYHAAEKKRAKDALAAQLKRVGEWSELDERALLAEMQKQEITKWSDLGVLSPDRADAFARDAAHLFKESHPLESGSIQRKVLKLLKDGHHFFAESTSPPFMNVFMDNTSNALDTNRDAWHATNTNVPPHGRNLHETNRLKEMDWQSKILAKMIRRRQRAVVEAAAKERADENAAATAIADTAAEDPKASDDTKIDAMVDTKDDDISTARDTLLLHLYCPRDTTADTLKAIDTANDAPKFKYILMVVLPTGKGLSTAAVFKSLKELVPVGCILPVDFAMEITKTGWRSLKTTPVDNWGKWRSVGLGQDWKLHPFLLRKSIAQASTAGE